MSYQINKTDGTIVSTVADGQVDTLSTDLTLIGKNYSGFGEALNENFIKLLENFAGTTRPTRPIRGQVWFDASESKLKVYNGAEFLPVSSATIANTQPTTLGVGDLWFNNLDKQLYFFDGTTPILLGPTYSASQDVSGLKVLSVLDTLNQTRVITLFYNNGILLGIFAKDSFTPKNAIEGFSGNITPGFNAGSLAGIKFNVTATNADALGGAVATTYVRKDTSNAINGQIQITSDLGLVVGSAGQANLTVTNGNVLLSNSATNKNLIVNVRRGIAQEDAIVIASDDRTIGLYAGFSSSQVNIGGDLVIDGNLTVNGDTVTVNTGVLVVEDKNIILARQEGVTPADDAATGGGIILQGSSSHVFLWSDLTTPAQASSQEAIDAGYNDAVPELYSQAWTSSEHINLAENKYFAIGGVPVLTATSLGASITSIPGVTSFGTLAVVNIGDTVDELRIQNNTISSVVTNTDIQLAPNGTGNVVLLGSPKITGLGAPTDLQDSANKEYVDTTVRSRALAFSINLSDFKSNSYIASQILTTLAPVAEYEEYTFARILCTFLNNSTSTLDINPDIQSGITTDVFNRAAGGSANAITSVSVPEQTIPSQTISVIRVVKTFRIIAGAWSYVSGSDVTLP